MAGAEDQFAVGVNSGPVKRHETALVSERVEIVSEVGLIIRAAKLARRRHHERAAQTFLFIHYSIYLKELNLLVRMYTQDHLIHTMFF